MLGAGAFNRYAVDDAAIDVADWSMRALVVVELVVDDVAASPKSSLSSTCLYVAIKAWVSSRGAGTRARGDCCCLCVCVWCRSFCCWDAITVSTRDGTISSCRGEEKKGFIVKVAELKVRASTNKASNNRAVGQNDSSFVDYYGALVQIRFAHGLSLVKVLW